MENIFGTPNEKIVVEVTPDKMLGIIYFELEEGEQRKLAFPQIKRLLQEKGIVFGIDEELIKSLCESRLYNYKYIIAKGEPGQRGIDAKLQYHFDHERINVFKPSQNEDGTVNFKDLNIIKNVRKDQVLVVKTLATEGVEGMDVLGRTIRVQRGRDVRIPKGKNTRILEDGLTLVSDIDGRLCYARNNIYVTPTFIVEKDVDSSTGNIDFIGSVIVRGNVQNGFVVKASGSVEVKGSVEAAEIISGGDVVVWYGIQGMDKGCVRAKGNIAAKFIQNASIQAEGDVVTEAIIHSRVAAQNIDVSKGKGLIVGGEVVANNQISANNIGSTMATHTEIQIGVPHSVLQQFHESERECKQIKEELDKTSQSIKFLMSKNDMLGQEKQELLKRLLTTKTVISARYKEVSKCHKALSERIEASSGGYVKVRDVLYSGVKITIGASVKYVREDYTHCAFRKDGVEIETLPYL